MRFTIEKHQSGYTVREMNGPDEFWGCLCGASTIDEALAFIRSRMEPEGEGEKGKTAPDHIEWFDDHKAFKARIDADRDAALNKLQRLGQEYDATPTDPPWKRAKVGDWVRIGKQIHVWQIEEFYQKETGLEMVALKHSNPSNGGHVTARKQIVEILPTPPRHGDFGSRPEEDGA